jgi:hypothetical protein
MPFLNNIYYNLLSFKAKYGNLCRVKKKNETVKPEQPNGKTLFAARLNEFSQLLSQIGVYGSSSIDF